ncbi:FAD-dependent monooxygenase, partial [Streptomyces sp. TOR3209]
DERQAPRYRVGRVFLAGDAAHIHSPAGGQGMNTGLQDAANLSWKLAAVVQGRAAERLLDSYESERHPVGRAVLRSSGGLVRLARARNPLLRAVRTLVAAFVDLVPPVRRKVLGQLTGIGYAYPAPRGAHRLTGTRVPDVALRDGRLHEALRGGRFVLITPCAYEGPGARDGRLTVGRWAGDRRTTVLVRPDGYVAWAAERADTADIEEAVVRALTGRTAARRGTPSRSW